VSAAGTSLREAARSTPPGSAGAAVNAAGTATSASASVDARVSAQVAEAEAKTEAAAAAKRAGRRRNAKRSALVVARHGSGLDGRLAPEAGGSKEGVGIVASIAIDTKDDADLVQIDTSHLFPVHTTWIGFRRGGLLRKYQLDFVQRFAPHLTKRMIEKAAGAASQAEVDELVKGVELPSR
jgi:hypothetical protein